MKTSIKALLLISACATPILAYSTTNGAEYSEGSLDVVIDGVRNGSGDGKSILGPVI